MKIVGKWANFSKIRISLERIWDGCVSDSLERIHDERASKDDFSGKILIRSHWTGIARRPRERGGSPE